MANVEDVNSENTESTQGTETQAQDNTPAPSLGMTAEAFNRAYTARERATLSKIEKILSQFTPNAPNAPTETDSTKNTSTTTSKDSDSTVAKLQRKVQEMEKREREANSKAQSAELRSSLTSLIKDKVSSTWLGDAVEKIAADVQFQDDRALLVFDDIPYSLDEGVSKWLSHDANKRFLPPKAAAKQISAFDILKTKSPEQLTPREKARIKSSAWEEFSSEHLKS